MIMTNQYDNLIRNTNVIDGSNRTADTGIVITLIVWKYDSLL